MHFYCLQHVPFETPGIITDLLGERGHSLQCIHLYTGDPLPSEKDFDGLVIMGDPMSVHDEEQFPWLSAEKELIAAAILAGGLGGLFWNIGANRLGVAVASLWVNLVPFFAILWSMAYGFRPNAYQIVGGLVALAGVVYMQWRKLPATVA